MADGLNKVMLIGYLGADPVHKVTSGNNDVVDLRLATSESWKDQSGNRQEQTEWHRIVVWGKQAIFARDYLKKGSKIYLEGKIRTRKWQDKEGKDQYTTEIVAKSFLFLDTKKDGQGSNSNSGGGSYGGGGGGGGYGGGGGGGSYGGGGYGSPPMDDDDIPF